jgi:hypothetical protein
MQIVLGTVAARHANDYMVMVMDGAGWHSSKKLVESLGSAALKQNENILSAIVCLYVCGLALPTTFLVMQSTDTYAYLVFHASAVELQMPQY